MGAPLMPYYVYKLIERPLRRVEPLGEFPRYPEASRFAKAKRSELAGEDCAVRLVFGANALEAEDALMNPGEPQPRVGDDY
jgi:hypothetical protein